VRTPTSDRAAHLPARCRVQHRAARRTAYTRGGHTRLGL
jgi:hypothetical protein